MRTRTKRKWLGSQWPAKLDNLRIKYRGEWVDAKAFMDHFDRTYDARAAKRRPKGIKGYGLKT